MQIVYPTRIVAHRRLTLFAEPLFGDFRSSSTARIERKKYSLRALYTLRRIMHKDHFDMYSYFIPNSQTETFERRKDARKKVDTTQLVIAKCRTMEGDFQAPIENVSSGGAFINTHQRLFVGQEIAMKFVFPNAGKTIMATGEIVRTSFEGAGIRFRLFFNK